MNPSSKVIVRDGTKYEIRWYEPGDESGLVELFSLIDESRDREWFRRTYVDLPYLNYVPSVIAETGDEIVGACPYAACPIRWRDEVKLAVFLQHLVVHPEHRGRGVYRAMNEPGTERYVEGQVALRISDPANEKTVDACRRQGHMIFEPPTRYFRIQHPDVLAEELVFERSSRPLRALTRPLTRKYFALRDRSPARMIRSRSRNTREWR